MHDKIKPCPFCGSSVERYDPMPGYVGGYGFRCKNCDAEILLADSDAEATKKWNIRTNATADELYERDGMIEWVSPTPC